MILLLLSLPPHSTTASGPCACKMYWLLVRAKIPISVSVHFWYTQMYTTHIYVIPGAHKALCAPGNTKPLSTLGTTHTHTHAHTHTHTHTHACTHVYSAYGHVVVFYYCIPYTCKFSRNVIFAGNFSSMKINSPKF